MNEAPPSLSQPSMAHPTPSERTPSSNNQPSTSFEIHRHLDNPSGPHYIECLKTDANQARWPTLGPVVDSKGATCQWVVSSSSLKSKWLTSLGRSIAKILGYSKKIHKEDWRLKDFPSNYQLYTYIKGNREDQYLFGSTNVLKFRTVNEFLPHLQWLASDGTVCCLCKYCSGAKNQLAINMALGLVHGSNDSSSSKSKTTPNQSADRAKRRKQSYSPPKNNHVFSTYEFQGPYLSEELNRDLLENRSNFRKHELVWCQVTDLILATGQNRLSYHESDPVIKFWPGLCEEMILCTESRTFISIDDDDDDKKPSVNTGNLSKRRLDQLNASPSKCIKNGFETRQRYKWKIRLLGLSDVVIREEVQILPWLFKTVDLKQKFGMKKRAGMSLPPHVQNTQESSRPRLDSFKNSDERLVAFQLALQTAANLEEFWVAHDRYDANPNLEACEKFVRMPHRTNPDESTSDLPVIWFQGLWWGAEKIWLYDVVRLNDFKRDSDFSSNPKISDEIPDELSTPVNKKDYYFLKIEGIYRDEAAKKLVVMGKIFDLVQSNKTPHPSSSLPSSGSRVYDKQNSKRSERWMPDPPTGYEFRQVTKPKEMIHLHVECISGRFYSPARTNQSDRFAEISRRLAPKVSQDDVKCNLPFPSFDIPSYQYLSHDQEQSFSDPHLVWYNASLFGLAPGQRNFMRCRKWRPSRAQSISEAEELAQQEMILAYEKLKLVDGNQEVEHASHRHHLKGFVAHGSKSSMEPGQNNVVVIEIDP